MAARACASAGIPFSVIDYPEMGVHGSGDDSIEHWISDHQRYMVNIFHITPDIFPLLYFKFGKRFFSDHFNIGYWAWELSKCPPEFDLALNMVDEVWAISEYMAESIRARSPVPVVSMPLAVSLRPLQRNYRKRYFGLPEKSFVFLFIFDSASYIDRKNPIATVRAFRTAIPRGDENVHLLLKTMNARKSDPLWDALMEEARVDSRITIMTKRLARDEMLGLYAVCDAFVSLHRAEGFGRCLAEAMLFGKPVVATNYSGTREFAREGTACLVDYSLVPVPKGSYPFWKDQVWAEPDLDHASAMMRRLVTDDPYRDKIAQAGQRCVIENFNEKVIGARYRERLNALKVLKYSKLPSPQAKAAASASISDDELNGFIDRPSPSSEKPIYASHIAVEGWVISKVGIESVEVYCDKELAGRAHYGILRADIGNAFPQMADATRSGYFLLVDVTKLSPGRHTVRVSARSRSGKIREWTRAFVLGDFGHLYEKWIANNAADTQDQRETEIRANAPKDKPLLSIILKAGSSFERNAVLRSFASLADQDYRAFEVVVLAGDTDGREFEAIADMANLSDRLRLLPTRTTDWTNAIGICHGEFVSLLDIGDVLDPRALLAVAQNISTSADVDFIYADEDLIVDGRRSAPIFKPAWSPIYLQGHNYIGRPWFARKALAADAATNIPHSNSASAEHTLLKLIGRSARAVCHIPMVLVSRGTKVTEAYDINSTQAPTAKHFWPRVSVIIPTRLADIGIVDRCFVGLIKGTDYPSLEVIIVANNLAEPDAGENYLKAWPFTILSWKRPFNWSAISNFGAGHATGDYLLFMNDDVEPLGLGWLKAMVDLARIKSVGAVGAVLRYPNGSIQHAGMTLVECGSGVRHTFRFYTGKEPQVALAVMHNREQSAVTGACLLTRRDCFYTVGGFDEELRLVANDTDYCLRLQEKGFSCVVASGAQLIHHEGISRARKSETNDIKRFWARWKTHLGCGDPFANPNLVATRDIWTIDPDGKGTLTGRIRRNMAVSMMSS